MRNGDCDGGQCMKRRWFIRSFFILLVLAVSVAWVRSYYISTYVSHVPEYVADKYKLTCLDSVGGSIYFSHHYKTGSLPSKWYWGDDANYLRFGWVNFAVSLHPSTFNSLFGFGYYSLASPEDQFFDIAIPFWFIDSITILIGLLVWCKTRPKPNPARAFPVETGMGKK